MIKGVFFDLDGTLIKSMHFHFQGWKSVLSKYNINISKKDFFAKEGTKLQELLKYFFNKNNTRFNIHLLEDLIKQKNKYFIENNKVIFYPGVRSLIRYLNKQDIYISIVTAGSRTRIKNSISKEFLKNFDTIVTGDDCKKGKPFPDPYLLSLKHSNLKKSECIIVENAPLGIKAGNAAGIKTLGITNTLDKKYLIKAKYIVDSALEIKKIIENINEKYS